MTSIIKKQNGHQPAAFGSVVDQIFQYNLSRFFDDNFRGFNGSLDKSSVPVNIWESGKSFEMELIAPGLKKSDFQLNLSNNMLTVSFENRQENKDENKQEGWIRQEFNLQSFSRSFMLDDSINANEITARYENGVLYLTLPKSEKALQLSRIIDVQ